MRSSEAADCSAFFFEDPALYDDYKLPEQESTNELQQSASSTANSNSTGSAKTFNGISNLLYFDVRNVSYWDRTID